MFTAFTFGISLTQTTAIRSYQPLCTATCLPSFLSIIPLLLIFIDVCNHMVTMKTADIMHECKSPYYVQNQ